MKTNKHAKFLSHLSPKRGRPTLGWTRPSPEVSGDDPPPFEWWDWCPLDELPPFLFKRPNPWETLVVGMCRDPRHPCHLEKSKIRGFDRSRCHLRTTSGVIDEHPPSRCPDRPISNRLCTWFLKRSKKHPPIRVTPFSFLKHLSFQWMSNINWFSVLMNYWFLNGDA